MASLILILIFVICLAMAAAAILISHQATTTYRGGFHRLYFYYLVAFYAFAVYGVWGQILGRALLSAFDAEAGLVEAVASFVSVLGVPMLFVAWLMLIGMAHALVGSAVSQKWLALHAAVFVLLLLGAWLGFTVRPQETTALGADLTYRIAAVMAILELLYVAGFLLVVWRSAPRPGEPPERSLAARRFSLLIAAAFAVRSAALPLMFLYPWVAIAVLLYFGSNLAPLFYLRATAERLFEPVKADAPTAGTSDHILDQYGITKRERQIVHHICSGKTNQQIADALFITLQTVKDHTHRIYSKMGVKNRIQLVQLMSGRAPVPADNAPHGRKK